MKWVVFMNLMLGDLVVSYCDRFNYDNTILSYSTFGGSPSSGVENTMGVFLFALNNIISTKWIYIGCYKEWYCDMGGFANTFAYYATGGTLWLGEYNCGGFLFWLFTITDYDTTIGCLLIVIEEAIIIITHTFILAVVLALLILQLVDHLHLM